MKILSLVLLALLSIGVPSAEARPFGMWYPSTPTTSALSTTAFTGGVEVQFLQAGTLWGLQTYRTSSDTTTSRNLILWSTGGTNLAQCSTSSESGTGWVGCNFTTGYAVAAYSTYIISADFPANQGLKATGGNGCGQAAGAPYLACITGFYNGTISTFPNTAQSNTLFVDTNFDPCFSKKCGKAAAFTADLDSNYTLTFDDEFGSLSTICANGTYSASCKWYNGIEACCMSPTTSSTSGVMYPNTVSTTGGGCSPTCNLGPINPYSLDANGGLDITLSEQSTAYPWNYWFSGVQQTQASNSTPPNGFSQQYGYFEMKAKLPAGKATWPSFWMLPSDTVNGKAEIDIFEEYGGEIGDNVLCITLHDYATPANSVGPICVPVATIDFSSDFHLYGMLIDATNTTFYFDRIPVWTHATIAKEKQAFYLLMDLGIGGGYSTATTPNPSVMVVKYVRAYKHN